MTTTDDRQSRTASDLFRFLPLALIITMFGLAVLIALLTSGWLTSGVYQVIAGDGAPWWQTGDEPPLAGVALLCGFTAAAAGVTTYLVNKRARPQEASWRNSVAAGTGFLGLALLIAGNLVIPPSQIMDILPILAFSPAATASACMGAWQYQLGGAGGHGRARRWVYAIGAAIVAALYTATFCLFLFFVFD